MIETMLIVKQTDIITIELNNRSIMIIMIMIIIRRHRKISDPVKRLPFCDTFSENIKRLLKHYKIRTIFSMNSKLDEMIKLCKNDMETSEKKLTEADVFVNVRKNKKVPPHIRWEKHINSVRLNYDNVLKDYL